MSDVPTTIGGFRVMSSGTLVVPMGRKIVMRPFLAQPEYALEINIRSLPDIPAPNSRIYSNGGTIIIDHTHNWGINNEAVVDRTVFGSDAANLYVINYFVKFVGDPNKYSIIFSYTTYVEPA